MRRLLRASIVLGLVVGVLLFPATAQAAFGIQPGKVYIDNLYPGAEADVPITIYNQGDYVATCVVSIREPDYTAEGYERFPHHTWITITPDLVTITPGGQAETLVVITMPEDADYSGKKSEIWISFKEKDTAGMIKIEICSRLLISTRVEATETPAEAANEPAEAPAEAANEPAEAPSVKGGSAVSITGGKTGEDLVTPIPPEKGETVSPFSPRALLSPVLGVILIGGAVFFLIRRRRRQHVLEKH